MHGAFPMLVNHPLCFRAVVALSLGAGLCLMLVGCQRLGTWDQEYTCQGQEQVSTHFELASGGADARKDYPLAIDFHVRGGQVLIKTYAAPIADPASNRLAFSVKGPMVWLNGAYDQQTRALTLVEERQLDTPLGRQSVRSTGRFQCQAVT